MWLNHHPSPGFGELLPGFFVVPQNPIWDNKSQGNAPNAFAGVKYIPSIGDILPGRFSVPQNPLIAQIRAGMSKLSGLGGCCCGADKGSGSGGANTGDAGTGFINGSPVLTEGMGDLLGGINWLTVAVAVGGTYLLMKGKGR
jgi:hypothetical protein